MSIGEFANQWRISVGAWFYDEHQQQPLSTVEWKRRRRRNRLADCSMNRSSWEVNLLLPSCIPFVAQMSPHDILQLSFAVIQMSIAILNYITHSSMHTASSIRFTFLSNFSLLVFVLFFAAVALSYIFQLCSLLYRNCIFSIPPFAFNDASLTHTKPKAFLSLSNLFSTLSSIHFHQY